MIETFITFAYNIENYEQAMLCLFDNSSILHQNSRSNKGVDDVCNVLDDMLCGMVPGFRAAAEEYDIKNDDYAEFTLEVANYQGFNIEKAAMIIRPYLDDDRPGWAYRVAAEVLKKFTVNN